MLFLIKFILSALIVFLMMIGISHVINIAINRHVAKVEAADAQVVKDAHDRLMAKFDGILNFQGK